MKRMLPIAGVLVLILTVNGCGFHLRGWTLESNIGSAHVVTDGRNFLAQPLRQALSSAGIDTTGGSASDVTIRLLDQRNDRRNASVGAGVRVAEVETTLAVQFAIDDVQGARLVTPRWIEGTRILFIDRSNITGSSEEQVLVEAEIRNDLVQQIVRSLDIALENRAGAP
ncbi:MAG: hypothetical protein QF921_08685 [Pseudomonadales bacterium]|jgi:LPS-assembly lipoprotein|nr:hypothetical protein [Pseudomonadales bacterium]MDP6470227.1 hypothetical protein [Pseudomonadales bacterium]MDP6827133.1 hypothetical protein [Pseudomonadales bacterium]MDP6971571.1 hypothetical protein [Pseudomonadales bacterium]|tara:strand:+ start:134 stop:640 length:507 start_codon:yes stop_codon:yes gene_type:complete